MAITDAKTRADKTISVAKTRANKTITVAQTEALKTISVAQTGPSRRSPSPRPGRQEGITLQDHLTDTPSPPTLAHSPPSRTKWRSWWRRTMWERLTCKQVKYINILNIINKFIWFFPETSDSKKGLFLLPLGKQPFVRRALLHSRLFWLGCSWRKWPWMAKRDYGRGRMGQEANAGKAIRVVSAPQGMPREV